MTIKACVCALLCAGITLIAGCSEENEPEEDVRVALQLQVNKRRQTGCNCAGTFMPAVAELQWNSALENAAQKHAEDMVHRNYFEHITPEGKAPVDRAAQAGYEGTTVTENIARGYKLAKEVVDAWVKSESHCKAMMDETYIEMGGAKYNNYWVLDFGKP